MNNSDKIELKKIFSSMLIPVFFMGLCWIVYIAENLLEINLSQYGLAPREISQWFGIFTMPFLHSDLGHIFANSVSFIVLGTMIFYFYSEKAIQIFAYSYLLTGILTWLIGIRGIHIGASGMVYAFAAYVFTVGVRSRNIQNMALSLVVVFLYGSMVWGLYPQNTGISWEGHLAGAISGVVLAYLYPTKHIEPEPFDEFDDEDFDTTYEGDDITIKYHYKQYDGKQSE